MGFLFEYLNDIDTHTYRREDNIKVNLKRCTYIVGIVEAIMRRKYEILTSYFSIHFDRPKLQTRPRSSSFRAVHEMYIWRVSVLAPSTAKKERKCQGDICI
jgi:hypothetical protein